MDKTKENIEEEAENLINEETETTAEENVSEAEDTTPQEEETENEEEAEEKDPLEAANEEIEQLKDKFLRTVAEFENYKKRTLKEKTELILNGAEKTVDAFLPVVDDFERALITAEKADDVAALKEGMELIYKKFMKTLEGLGVKKIETEDADFDVDYHEAVAMVPAADDDKKGKVIDCIQTGYTLNDKVIRHAKVAVGQ
ncbi:nucleotide exchange factor GrpE [Prevotella sp. Rep29]|uniref:nucleotide exchange factor GrpE n=1 Tax=Prevotella sp. Rep29 TaxID=2691580 RepID=UPI001C6E9231|nr:nucleotide exchange factor GrpE [Prevotella sp. Rep29]QYR10976.1 nucleotide exchange factor GrpE [Prevotella sp. Rep29]